MLSAVSNITKYSLMRHTIFFTVSAVMAFWVLVHVNNQVSFSASSSQELHRPPPALQDTRMRALISSGCSGSSATGSIIKEVLKAHGYILYPVEAHELLVPRKNKFYRKAYENLLQHHQQQQQDPTYEKTIVEAMRLMHEEAVEQNQMLYFKASVHSEPLLDGLQQIGITFSHMYRSNALDRCVCRVRDCFGQKDTYGYPVFANNGTETDLCFKRRQQRDVKTQAYFMPGMASACVRHMETSQKRIINRVRNLILPGTSVTYEDLFAFSSTLDENIFDHSVQAWVSLTSSLIDNVNEDVIRDVLRPKINTRSPPSAHKEVIYNIEETVQELQESSFPLEQYIRF